MLFPLSYNYFQVLKSRHLIRVYIALLPCYSKITLLRIYVVIYDTGKHHGNAVEMETLIPNKSQKSTQGRRNEFIIFTDFHIAYKSST